MGVPVKQVKQALQLILRNVVSVLREIHPAQHIQSLTRIVFANQSDKTMPCHIPYPQIHGSPGSDVNDLKRFVFGTARPALQWMPIDRLPVRLQVPMHDALDPRNPLINESMNRRVYAGLCALLSTEYNGVVFESEAGKNKVLSRQARLVDVPARDDKPILHTR